MMIRYYLRLRQQVDDCIYKPSETQNESLEQIKPVKKKRRGGKKENKENVQR
jgi:hypothetical protein